MVKTHKNNSIHPLFQTITLFFTLSVVAILCYRFMNKFCAIDPRPPIQLLSEKKIVSKSKIEVGFSINDLIEFNSVENKFTISAVISFLFDPKIVPLEKIEQFNFEKGTIESKSKVASKEIDGKMLARYNIKFSFNNNMYYGYFPFEDRRLYIVLDNSEIHLQDAAFKSSNVDLIVCPVHLPGWKSYDKKVYEGYISTKITLSNKVNEEILNPRIIFEIDYFHHSFRSLYLILLPLLLIFVIEIFAFCVDQEKYRNTLFSLSVVDIGALFAYRFVIQTISPDVAYLTLADYFFLIFLSTSFFTFFINGTGLYFSRFWKKVICISLQIYLILAFVYFLEFWPCCVC